MEHVTLRPLTARDADQVHQLAERFFQVAFGHATFYTPEVIVDLLTAPGVVPELDAMVLERGGRLLAAAHVTARAPFSEASLGVVVEPELDAATMHRCLLLMCEQFDAAMHARSATPEASSDAAQCIPIPRSMPLLGEAAAALGFVVQRHVYSMLIEFGGGVPAPAWPAGINWRPPTLDPRDVDAMSTVFRAAFVDHPGDGLSADEVAHEMTMPSTSLPLSIIAEDDAGPVGVTFTMVEEQGGYVGGIGVLPRGRRRGLATAMLRQTFCGLADAGVPCCRLHVEAVNPGAVALYERVGMTAESVTDLWLRPTPRRGAAPTTR